MELHIQSDFDCVFSVNGEFFERADSITMNEYDVAYVTVFPLKFSLLPYTIKLVGAENIKSELATGVRLSSEHYLLSLAPRYSIVYGCAPSAPVISPDPISRLFALVKNGDIIAAMSMLSPDLKTAIDKTMLEEFFAPYERIAECKWESGTKFYLIDKNGAARLHSYALKDGFIDDLTELD